MCIYGEPISQYSVRLDSRRISLDTTSNRMHCRFPHLDFLSNAAGGQCPAARRRNKLTTHAYRGHVLIYLFIYLFISSSIHSFIHSCFFYFCERRYTRPYILVCLCGHYTLRPHFPALLWGAFISDTCAPAQNRDHQETLNR